MRHIFHSVLIAGLIGVGPANASGEEIPFAIGEWPPYTSQYLDGYGFMSKIATALAHEVGMTPTFSFQPWVRCEEKVLAGKAFATYPYAITEKRKQDFDFLDPVITSKHMFFYNKRFMKTPVPFGTVEDLKTMRIGGVRGYYYIEELEKAGLKIEFTPEDEQNVMKLHAGRVDLIVMDNLLGWTLIKKYYQDEVSDFAVLDKPLSVTEMSFMISRKYPDAKNLREKMNQALKRVMQRADIKVLIELN